MNTHLEVGLNNTNRNLSILILVDFIWVVHEGRYTALAIMVVDKINVFQDNEGDEARLACQDTINSGPARTHNSKVSTLLRV